MPVTLTVGGVPFSYPVRGDTEWGLQATAWAQAITAQALQKSAGTYQITAELDFGTLFGLKSLYYKSRAAAPASTGQIRLGNTEGVYWRNEADDGNLGLTVDPSTRELLWDGIALGMSTARTVGDTSTIDLTLTVNEITADIVADSITNSLINSAAAIAYSKLDLSDSIVDADVNSAAAIAYSKLALSDSIVDADVNSAAAIAYSKLALSGSIVNADVNSAAAIAYSKLDLSDSIVDADVNSAAAIAYSKLALSNSIVNADINSAAAIAVSKLAALTASRAVVTDGSGFLSPSAVTSTELGYVSGVTSAIQTQLAAKLALAGGTLTGQLLVNLGTGAELTNSCVRAFGYSPAFELIDKDSVANWHVGLDDNDSNALVIGQGYGPGQSITPALKISTSNNITMPAAGTLTLPADPTSALHAATKQYVDNNAGGLYASYALLQHQETSGTNAGGSTAGSYVERAINTEVSDADGIVSISSNRFTLGAGTYHIRASGPCFRGEENKIRITNTSDATVVAVGQNGYAAATNAGGTDLPTTVAHVSGVTTIASSKTFSIEHRCARTQGTNGLGRACGFGDTEVYTIVEIWKFA